MTIVVEAAVDSLEDALAAVDGGADRLELCANLSVGGTTPDQALIAAVVSRVRVPVAAMVRPRGGSFVYSDIDIGHMRRDIEMALDLGVAAVVLGVLDSSNRIDAGRSASLIDVAGASRVTFHRAFDRTPDPLAAIDTLMSLGVARVLTSGGAPTALEGVETLASLVARAGERLRILAGGGVRANNVRAIVNGSGVREVHARCERDATRIRGIKAAIASS
ncbi:MAG TPA: copper homeostasis protein CutC [Gemmatimonadaceae bacterium]